MWTRETNTWVKYKFEQSQRKFKDNYLEQILMYQKCVNAVTYMPVDNLDDNIYNLYDYYSLDNWEEYHNTIKTYYTPGNVIDGLINIIQVDVASTEDIDISLSYINPIIDTITLVDGHLVLLKDQTNTVENGIYKFTNGKFEQVSSLVNYADRLNFSVYIKLGGENKNLQFFLERDVTSLYPSDTDAKTFKEGHNYIIKHKFEYKNLQDVTLHDGAIKLDSFSASGFDVTHNKGGTSEIVIENVPAGTLPSVVGGKIYITVIGHTDPDLILNEQIEILSEVVVPNGPNFDHTYTTAINVPGPPSPTENVSVRFDYDISFAVGEFGLLIKDYSDFDDGRKTELIITGDKNRLRGVHMSSDSFGNFTGYVYTCGNNGAILKSVDYGTTFEKLPSITTNNLHDVHFYNLTVGVAVGELGTVLITEDGGNNWTMLQPTDINEQKVFNAVYMNSLDQAIIVGDRGLFFVLNKIGSNWEINRIPLIREENSLVSYPIINDMNDIYYDVTNDYFYVVGSEGFMLRIDSNFDLVFFEDVTTTIEFNSIDKGNAFFILAGDDEKLYGFAPIVTLNPDSNVSPTVLFPFTIIDTYEDDHVYNRAMLSLIKPDDIVYGIGNHTFYKSTEGSATWSSVYTTLFDEIKTKLLVLDYKLGRKMYFINNSGDVVKPTRLYDTSLPGTELPGLDVLSLTDTNEVAFIPYNEDHNFWQYYIEHNLYDITTGTKPNDFFVTNTISDYKYGADNVVDGGATDVVVNDDHILLKLTNTVFNANPGDLIRVDIKETVPTFSTFLTGVFMVISWDGTYLRVNEIFNDTLTNDLHNGPYPFTMEVINLTYLEEGNYSSFVDNWNDAFFGFYTFTWDNTDMVVKMEAADKSLTSYFNMRMNIYDSTGNDYVLDYKENDLNFKYGPYYNILNTLSDIDPIFTPGKTFNMPQIAFTYESSSLSPDQFVFDGNKIVMGSNHAADWEQYYVNTFVDIVHNASPILTRVLILKKETAVVNGLTRYYLYFDYFMQELVSGYGVVTSDTIEIKSRNTLEEISYDLTRTDDVHHDMFQLLLTDNVINRQYKEGLATINTNNYAKILLQDSDIKEHVTGIIYTDNNFDLAFNVLNVSGDPSFNFEPVDLYDVGVDEIPKRSNAIDPTNVDTFIAANTKTGRTITGIDFNKYAFRLVDGLDIITLSQKYGWILETEMKDAVIGEDENGLVWYTGEWFCGIWADGTWYSGIFHDGIWIDGTWNSRAIEDLGTSVIVKQLSGVEYSLWLGGTWIDGVWNNGSHFDGEWIDGTWNNGLWLNGQWDEGTWNNGNWKGGLWITGIWNDGTFSMENATSIWFFGYWNGGDFKNGIWKDGFFNQAFGKLSRFGTESTYQLRSIWENGSFVNGEIHTFANVENGDVNKPLLSEGYQYTVFNAGEVRSGACYGATFKQGNWYGGTMLQGYVEGKIEIDVTNFQLSGDTLTLDVQGYQHYIKEGDRIQLIGDVDLSYLPAPITPTHEQIGYNTNPVSHIVQSVDFNNGNIDILLDNPSINDINGTFGAYLTLNIAFTVHGGTWENSLWNYGLWLGGTWYGGLWMDGIWEEGKWMDENNPQP